MDTKDTWPVVKFIIAATGFKRRDARKLLGEISTDHYSRLYLEARKWDQEALQKASASLSGLLGDDTLRTLRDATKLAQVPSGGDAGDEDDDMESKRRTKTAARRRTSAKDESASV